MNDLICWGKKCIYALMYRTWSSWVLTEILYNLLASRRLSLILKQKKSVNKNIKLRGKFIKGELHKMRSNQTLDCIHQQNKWHFRTKKSFGLSKLKLLQVVHSYVKMRVLLKKLGEQSYIKVDKLDKCSDNLWNDAYVQHNRLRIKKDKWQRLRKAVIFVFDSRF